MIKNFFLVAYRNLVKSKLFSFINIAGLSVGMAACVLRWGMHKWLQDFAYRVNIGWWTFLVAAVAALFIALITISFQAIKAAITNPVKSLRTE